MLKIINKKGKPHCLPLTSFVERYFNSGVFFVQKGELIIRRKTIYLLSLQLVILVICISIFVERSTRSAVALTIDGEELIILTHANTVGELLEEKEIQLNAQDKISHPKNVQIQEKMKISLNTAKEITLMLDENEKTYKTTAETVNEFLSEHEISLNEYDEVQPGLNSPIEEDMAISIKKAKTFKLIDNGKKTNVWTQARTVGDLLKEQGIELSNLDRVQPFSGKVLRTGITINIIRVEQRTKVLKENIKFKVISKKDPSLAIGRDKVAQEGVNGSIRKHYIVTYKNGKEVTRKLEKSKILKRSKDKIVLVGTKKIRPSVSHKDTSLNVSRKDTGNNKEFYVTATAYTANCLGCTGTTATGINLEKNPNIKVIAVDPSVIPLGSKVWVEGYGYAIAADKGGAIKGNKIDLFMKSSSEVSKYGRRTVKIKVL